MKRLRDTFKKIFGEPIESVIPLPAPLRPVGNKQDTLLYGSTEAAEFDPSLFLGSINSFLQEGKPGYFLTGFWGYGANSYAFYYARIDAWGKVFFRLPYGGVYMDNDEEARRIPVFLKAFFSFETRIRERGASLVAVDAMGRGSYSIVTEDRRRIEVPRSFYRDPGQFQLIIDDVFGGGKNR